MDAYKAIELNAMDLAIVDFTNALYDPYCLELIKKEEIRDALSGGQLISKKWLVEAVFQNVLYYKYFKEMKVVVCGGWTGILAQALNHLDPRLIVDSMDLDAMITEFASMTMINSRGKAIQGDMYDFDYAQYQCVVNTSAEHIPDVKEWSSKLASDTFVVVQSNNARHIPEHISCVDSAMELSDKLQLSTILVEEQIEFPMYTRFMVIGKK
jgi:hypothetical protein